MTTPLTKEEKQWITKIEKLLLNPPSNRLGLYTTGDCGMSVYDSTFENEIEEIQNDREVDFCFAVNQLGCDLGEIRSACNIHSTAG